MTQYQVSESMEAQSENKQNSIVLTLKMPFGERDDHAWIQKTELTVHRYKLTKEKNSNKGLFFYSKVAHLNAGPFCGAFLSSTVTL